VRPPEVSDLARPHFTLTDWLRAALLCRALASVALERQPALVQGLFEAGEIGEQESVLRTLSLLPEPMRFVETGLLGCRTNARRVFEAIACDNAYPERYFSDFRTTKWCSKRFSSRSRWRASKVPRRNGAELVRMARDYASERRAAGRPVPADIDSSARRE
jgi:hypothetical protein